MDKRLNALELSSDFQYALDQIEKTHKHLFITGKAGTGKSTLLRLFRNTTRKRAVFLAPTGVAALNIGGQTIHSFFGFPPKPITKKDIKPRRFKRLYKKIDVLIIDEISMVRADMIDNIDHFLRINREEVYLPFGGVQVVFFGDLFQLPPVVSSPEEKILFKTYYESPYFFSAHLFENLEMEMIELHRIYRQEERHFIRLLDAVRTNSVDYDDLEDLNERFMPDFTPEDFYITLSARNARVDSINQKELGNLDTEIFDFYGKTTGSFSPKLFPAPMVLKLKKNAQVMFIKNDQERQYVNGTIGKIVEIDLDKIIVEITTQEGQKKQIEAKTETWEVLKYKIDDEDNDKIKTEIIGTFTQYPLKLAWAITIHKSQGKTFDRAMIDMGRGAFEHGQTYVALSRCRTLQGIILKERLRPRDILVDERIIDFYQQMH